MRAKAALTLLLGLLACAGWFWHAAEHDSSVPFLPKAGPAEWIVYPKPPDSTPRRGMLCSATFRRSFTLATAPSSASLSVRVFRQGAATINGKRVDDLRLVSSNWKQARTLNVASLLRPGTNDISIIVTNLLGPPALCLELQGEGLSLMSDPLWQVSLLGAVWQPAALASAPPAICPGNHFYGRETVSESLHRAWPAVLIILLVCAVAAIVGEALARTRIGKWATSPKAPLAALALIVIAWAILFANNLPQLGSLSGFDRDGHQQYIDYILQKKALPLANEGWQMYQPPFFYLLAAAIIGPFGWTASSDAGLLVLRSLSVVTGLAHLGLIFLCLRLLFPQRPSCQVVGLLFAGLLPANLCLSHHLTNENLAAAFVTASLYFCLRLLKNQGALGESGQQLTANSVSRGACTVSTQHATRNTQHALALQNDAVAMESLHGPAAPPSQPHPQHSSPARLAVAVGACLGLALLTKFSAVLALPFVLVALAWPSPGKPSVSRAVTCVSFALASLLLVCGWHFARVWHRFGTPILGNWDPSLPFAWWQDPGYHTAGWYRRFGEALICPLFSSLTAFADGAYSTLWGDGLCSGSAGMYFRPQWNYDLMNAGYLLALFGTLLVGVGCVVLVGRFLRRPSAAVFLVPGMVFAFGAGIILMTLRVASYAQVKSFYALPALLPLSVLAVAGWDLLARSRLLRPLLWTGLLAWAATSYASFWIRAGSASTYSAQGIGLSEDGRYAEAVEQFNHALRLDPNSLSARNGLTKALNSLGKHDEAWRQATLALQQHPDEATAHTHAASLLGLDRRYDEAIAHLHQALAEAPDHPTAYEQLAACLGFAHRPQEQKEACAEGLRVTPFNPNLHKMLAAAAGETGDFTNAITHLRIALALKPHWPEAQGMLATALAGAGQLGEAAEQYKQAIQEKPDDPRLRYSYAFCLGLQGKAAEAADQYRYLLSLQPDNVEVLNNLAWTLAASPLDNLRNGSEAVRLATRACELTQRRAPVLLGTLAAAYAEAGQFQDAVQTAEQARSLALSAGQKDVAEANARLLQLYRAGKAYHEPGPGGR
ncbi:MAG TPA: tetratricopeptide repeat protein [Candidatus Acidoferrum sp.]|nr:tetratricopeptide repeat protein [Candidatus Acidoferrum sp.]